MQLGLDLGECICQNRYVINVVLVRNWWCVLSTASFLCQSKAIFFDQNLSTFDVRSHGRLWTGIGKNPNGFRRKWTTTSQIFPIRWIMEEAKHPHPTPLDYTIICKLFQGFWLHTQREDGTNTSSLWPPQGTVAAKMLLDKNTKVKVLTLDGDTDFFDIVAGVLQGDTLAPYYKLGYFLFLSNYNISNSFKRLSA